MLVKEGKWKEERANKRRGEKHTFIKNHESFFFDQSALYRNKIMQMSPRPTSSIPYINLRAPQNGSQTSTQMPFQYIYVSHDLDLHTWFWFIYILYLLSIFTFLCF